MKASPDRPIIVVRVRASVIGSVRLRVRGVVEVRVRVTFVCV